MLIVNNYFDNNDGMSDEEWYELIENSMAKQRSIVSRRERDELAELNRKLDVLTNLVGRLVCCDDLK